MFVLLLVHYLYSSKYLYNQIKILLRWLHLYQKGWILFPSLHLLHNNCIICLFQFHFCCWQTPFHVTFIMKFDKWIKMLLGFIQNMILSTYLHTKSNYQPTHWILNKKHMYYCVKLFKFYQEKLTLECKTQLSHLYLQRDKDCHHIIINMDAKVWII